jgi:hypothetical protein
MRVLIGKDEQPTKRLSVRWLFEPRDCWIGVFWNQSWDKDEYFTLVYICLLPCLPIVFCWKQT